MARKIRVGFQGERGAFSEKAALQLALLEARPDLRRAIDASAPIVAQVVGAESAGAGGPEHADTSGAIAEA